MKKLNLKEMMKMTDYCSTCHCEGVRKHDCGNPFFRVEKNLDCHAHFRSLAMTGKKKVAFTLAETLITLTILGVVAAITVPMLINKQMEAANRTKVKKAMTNYEKALSQILVENDIKSDIRTFFSDCSETTKYFKKIESKNDCVFKTADKIWWNIADIGNPIIMLDDKYKDTNRDELYSMARQDNSENNEVFSFVGRIDSKTGAVRINDKGYEDSITFNNDVYPMYLAKLYSFINNIEDLDLKYSKACPNQCDVMGYLGGGSSGCSGCSFEFEMHGANAKVTWNDDGSLNNATTNRIFPDGSGFKSKFNISDNGISYTSVGYYSTGEKEFDETCSNYNIVNDNCFGEREDIYYYQSGKVRAKQKVVGDNVVCYKSYNQDGSLNHINGDGCED